MYIKRNHLMKTGVYMFPNYFFIKPRLVFMQRQLKDPFINTNVNNKFKKSC